jgi:hypothetical protein
MAVIERKSVVSDELVRTLFQVTCDHPTGERCWEYGVNMFLFQGPTAEADARIRVAELTTVGRTTVAVARQEHRRVRRQGERVARDRFIWSDVV